MIKSGRRVYTSNVGVLHIMYVRECVCVCVSVMLCIHKIYRRLIFQ